MMTNLKIKSQIFRFLFARVSHRCGGDQKKENLMLTSFLLVIIIDRNWKLCAVTFTHTLQMIQNKRSLWYEEPHDTRFIRIKGQML